MTKKNLGGRPRLTKKPRNKLTTWMRAAGISATELATKLEVTPSAVYALRDGKFRPGLPVAIKLEKLSDGAVPASYWLKVQNKSRRA